MPGPYAEWIHCKVANGCVNICFCKASIYGQLMHYESGLHMAETSVSWLRFGKLCFWVGSQKGFYLLFRCCFAKRRKNNLLQQLVHKNIHFISGLELLSTDKFSCIVINGFHFVGITVQSYALSWVDKRKTVDKRDLVRLYALQEKGWRRMKKKNHKWSLSHMFVRRKTSYDLCMSYIRFLYFST